MDFDLQVHSHFSKDAVNDPKKIAKFFAKKKMGFAITDHNIADAWPAIQKYARHYKAECVFGEEIKAYDSGRYIGEFIGLFLSEPVKPGQYEEVLDALKKQDAIISVSHPFDILRSPAIIKPMFTDAGRAKYILKRIQAVEGHNSRMCFQAFNRKALDFAKENSLAVTGGSDGHFPQELGNGFTTIEGSTAEELYDAIKKKRSSCGGRLSSPFVHVLTQFAKRGKRSFY